MFGPIRRTETGHAFDEEERTTGGNYFHPRSVLFFDEKLSISFYFV
jgi:hypothetical protein